MSVAPLSINSQREEAVDFTKPFMTRYISVLMKVPKSTTSYFEFLNPLHPVVWFCTIGAFVFVSIVLYILERIGNVNRAEYPSISFKECFWFVFNYSLINYLYLRKYFLSFTQFAKYFDSTDSG